MLYKFESVKVVVPLSFKYEHTVGFRRSCSFLEHLAFGCRGPSWSAGLTSEGGLVRGRAQVSFSKP